MARLLELPGKDGEENRGFRVRIPETNRLDKLDIFTQSNIQSEVNQVTEATALFLGISLDNLEVYQGLMKDLQKNLERAPYCYRRPSKR